MESDTVRTIGDSTMVDIWLKGRMRGVSVRREAIAAYLDLPPESSAEMSDDDRSEFVRRNLSLVAAAALAWLSENPGQDNVLINAGQLARPGRGTPGERRAGDRRKGDRRKANLGPPGVERRRS
jgi:hypothetical protein